MGSLYHWPGPSDPSILADPGLFFTSLDSSETKSVLFVGRWVGSITKADQERIDRAYRGDDYEQNAPLGQCEESFRHSGWRVRRERVRAALVSTMRPAARVVRFERCGCLATVERSADGKDYRVRASYCHDRWCVPCARMRAQELIVKCQRLMRGKRCLFVTVTQKATDETIGECIDKLYRRMAKLKAGKWWRKHVAGGMGFVEVKLGEGSGKWHVHCHMIVESGWLPQRALSDEWLRVTGDSYICDVRRVDDSQPVTRYITKYVTKGVDDGVALQPSLLGACVVAFAGRRLCSTFGTWRRQELEADVRVEGGWSGVGSLEAIFTSARCGDADAIYILSRLAKGYDVAVRYGWQDVLRYDPPPE